jgi:16S rRNA (guanine527-N7)-methyltransferase
MNPDDRVLAVLGHLAALHGIGRGGRDQLAELLELLERDDRAPTTVRSAGLAVDTHIADSLAALDFDPVRSARRIADIGAGAGFPGVPLAVARPECEVRLIESQSRKCVFLEDVVERIGIQNVRVVCARAEEWSEGLSAHDVVVARAVGPQPVVLEYAAPLLRLGGTLVDWRGRRAPEEEEIALRAAGELGLELVGVERVQPFEAARDRHLHIYAKARETPARFPRRAGMARKRPLGR